MKKIFYILFLIVAFAKSEVVFAQQKSNPTLDSIKIANQLRKELTAAKLDSIKQARATAKELREKLLKEKKKSSSKLKKKKITNQNVEDEINIEGLSKADSIKLISKLRKEALIKKQDSIYENREIAKAQRQEAIDIKYEKLEASRRKKGIPFTQEFSFGYRLCTDGWAFFINRGFIKTDDEKGPHTNSFWIDLSEKKHPKEKSITNDIFTALYPNEPKPLSYKYGKINNFYQLKFGIGNSKPISGKLENKNVIINWNYSLGISLGMLKPYYLDLILPEGSGYIRKFAKYEESTKPYFLDTSNQGYILGGANFTKGISEIKFKPGLALKSGFYFDYSPSKKIFTGLELGASAEIYAQKIPIMATVKSSNFFFNLYADFRFGKRWE